MNKELIRQRLEWVKHQIRLQPERFDQRNLVGEYPCVVGCIAGWLDFMIHGEEHWEHTAYQVRETAARMIGSGTDYPALFQSDIHAYSPGTIAHAEAACAKIDVYLGAPTRSEIDEAIAYLAEEVHTEIIS